MRILHIITTLNRGGAENHLVDLVQGQRIRGLQVDVAYLKGDGYWTDKIKRLGCDVYALGLRWYGDPKPCCELRRLIRHLEPSLVHAHLPPAELYTRLALIGLNNPPALVISKHNDASFYQGIASRTLGKWIASCACHIIAISNAVRIYMIKEFNLPEKQISTIHYGIDPVPYSEVPAKEVAALRSFWLSGNTGWVIGTVARLVPEKALHTLIEGYATYREQATKASRLVIVGRGRLEQELKQFAEHLGIGNKVIWSGFREDIPAVMAAFDLFALTSIREGFGMVLLEAMAAKRPIVASAVSAIPEVVVDGRTGILFPALGTNRLADAFLMFETDSIRRSYGQAGYELVSSHFTLDKMVERTLEIYREHLTSER